MMKAAHRKRVRDRLARVQALLADRERIARMLRRVDPSLTDGSELHNQLDAMERLMGTDVPQLLDEVDRLATENLELRREVRVLISSPTEDST